MSHAHDDTDSSLTGPRKAVVWALRLLQVLSVGAALVFVLGALMGGMSAYAFLVVGVTAILLFLFTIILEFVVRAVQ